MNFFALILSLPTENATVRQRCWRALKACGSVVLRDGVYLMPDREECHVVLKGIAADVGDGGGVAHLLRIEEVGEESFVALFDRSHEYAAFMNEVDQVRQTITADTVQDMLRLVRKLRKSFTALVDIDFFPGESQRQAENAMQGLEQACARAISPDEPHDIDAVIAHLSLADYQNRVWATRARPWVDRLASAWLIQRFIDKQARFLWLPTPQDCPADALGFDFDDATFSHVGGRVTFEVLASSFNLEQPAITRLGQLVHFLDVGGVQPPEASGIESVLAGFRETIMNDDQLLSAACAVFDGLLSTFERNLNPSNI